MHARVIHLQYYRISRELQFLNDCIIIPLHGGWLDMSSATAYKYQ